MARYTGAVCRLCRREGDKLFLKGARCYTNKCALSKREYAPGQHGQGRKKMSEYGTQLREKQKAKRYYGLLENQFYHYFELASKMEGKAGDNLISVLESRLDNVAYRMGMALTRREARQLVGHGHFMVNGKRVDIPSYRVAVGDEIAVCEKSRTSAKFKDVAEQTQGRVVPLWLEANKEAFSAKVTRTPGPEDLDYEVEAHLIVELYSK